MRFKTGKHSGNLTEAVLLKEPDFAVYMPENYADGVTAKDFAQLRKKFDARPFAVSCSGHSCSAVATRRTTSR